MYWEGQIKGAAHNICSQTTVDEYCLLPFIYLIYILSNAHTYYTKRTKRNEKIFLKLHVGVVNIQYVNI